MTSNISDGQTTAFKKTEKPRSHRRTMLAQKTVIAAVLIIYAILLMLPFMVVIVTSVTPYSELTAQMTFVWWPENPTFSAYKRILTEDPMIYTQGMSSIAVGFINTLWSVLLPLVISLFLSGLSAYAYAKWDFKGKETIFMIQVATIMIPTACFTVPSFIFFNALGWSNSFLPIVIPGCFGSATTILFLRGFMTGIPSDIVEAARIDGLNIFRIYINVILPLSVPALIAQFIFGFVGGYNNYAAPLLYLYGDNSKYTLMLAITELKGFFPHNNDVCAATVIAIVPLLVLYAFCQKFFIKGIALGGGKE